MRMLRSALSRLIHGQLSVTMSAWWEAMREANSMKEVAKRRRATEEILARQSAVNAEVFAPNSCSWIPIRYHTQMQGLATM